MEIIIMGVIIYVIGVGLNRLHDALWIPVTKDGLYDARYRRGGFLGRLFNRLGVFFTICGIISIFIM